MDSVWNLLAHQLNSLLIPITLFLKRNNANEQETYTMHLISYVLCTYEMKRILLPLF